MQFGIRLMIIKMGAKVMIQSGNKLSIRGIIIQSIIFFKVNII